MAALGKAAAAAETRAEEMACRREEVPPLTNASEVASSVDPTSSGRLAADKRARSVVGDCHWRAPDVKICAGAHASAVLAQASAERIARMAAGRGARPVKEDMPRDVPADDDADVDTICDSVVRFITTKYILPRRFYYLSHVLGILGFGGKMEQSF